MSLTSIYTCVIVVVVVVVVVVGMMTVMLQICQLLWMVVQHRPTYDDVGVTVLVLVTLDVTVGRRVMVAAADLVETLLGFFDAILVVQRV
jgi:hypothetical protein